LGGGAQVINIAVSLVKMKVVAVMLEPQVIGHAEVKNFLDDLGRCSALRVLGDWLLPNEARLPILLERRFPPLETG
jgi:hypothetical protein